MSKLHISPHVLRACISELESVPPEPDILTGLELLESFLARVDVTDVSPLSKTLEEDRIAIKEFIKSQGLNEETYEEPSWHVEEEEVDEEDPHELSQLYIAPKCRRQYEELKTRGISEELRKKADKDFRRHFPHFDDRYIDYVLDVKSSNGDYGASNWEAYMDFDISYIIFILNIVDGESSEIDKILSDGDICKLSDFDIGIGRCPPGVKAADYIESYNEGRDYDDTKHSNLFELSRDVLRRAYQIYVNGETPFILTY